MDISIKIDSYVLGKVQAFSDWMQATTGKDCFWCARALKPFLGIACVMSMITELVNPVDGIIGTITTIVVAIFSYYKASKATKDYTMKQMGNFLARNPGELRLQYERTKYLEFLLYATFGSAFFLLVAFISSLTHHGAAPPKMNTRDLHHSIVSTFELISFLLVMLLTTIILYLCSCTPKPPSKSKIKQIVESIREALSPQPSLSPA